MGLTGGGRKGVISGGRVGPAVVGSAGPRRGLICAIAAPPTITIAAARHTDHQRYFRMNRILPVSLLRRRRSFSKRGRSFFSLLPIYTIKSEHFRQIFLPSTLFPKSLIANIFGMVQRRMVLPNSP